MITLLLLTGALCILGWGLYRSLPYGRLGLLSWLQSLVVMLPWFIFFGLSAIGILLNLVAVLSLIVAATGTYILLGQKLRDLAKVQQESDRSNPPTPNSTSPAPNSPSSNSSSLSSENLESASSEATSPETSLSEAHLSEAHLSEAESPEGIPSESAPKKAEALPSPSTSTNVTKTPPSSPLFPAPESPSLGEDGGEKPSQIPAEDIQKISSIFGIDTFFSIEQTPYYNGMLFKGNLRGEPTTVYDALSSRLSTLFGSKYRLFLMEDQSEKPIVVVFPITNEPKPATRMQWITAGCLFVVTMLTCMAASAAFQGFDLIQEWSRWPETLLLTVGISIVLVGHEVGHWLMARRYDVRLGPPFFLPTWQIGSFGALTRLESVLPHRTALFDIAFAGPAIGGGLAFVFFLTGLVLSHPGSVFQLSPTFFHSSVLVGTLARVFLGSHLQQEIVDIHPFVIVGWLGLLITAINVMPVGQLDGGRIVQAIYGRKVIRRASVVTLVVLAIATLFNPLALYWMVVILFLQRQLEQPHQNELIEPDDTRAALGLLALFLMAAMLLPLSPELASRLGIGG